MTNPSYVLLASPTEPNHLKNLFASGANTIASQLERPPVFRYAGWSLETLDQAHIVGGEFLEVKNGPRKTVRIYEDGTLLLRADAGPDFLGWGRDEVTFPESPRLHPLAAVEITTLFVHFYATLIPHFARPLSDIRFVVKLTDGKIGNRFMHIVPYPLNTIGWTFQEDKFSLRDETVEKEVVIAATEVEQDPNRAAYRLVERLFLFFGVPIDKIPYVVETEAVKRVDVERIKKT